MDMSKIMKQAKDLQKKLAQQQEELATKEFSASVGGGMVTVKANGKGELLSIALDPEVVNKDDIGMLQDLVLAAVNQALKEASDAQQSGMSSMMGGMGLKMPGLF